jgi:hypothetical protein
MLCYHPGTGQQGLPFLTVQQWLQRCTTHVFAFVVASSALQLHSLPTQAPSSPLLGVGELHAAREAADVRRRNLSWFREQERVEATARRTWGEASVQVTRPASAGRVTGYGEVGGGAGAPAPGDHRGSPSGQQRPASAYAGGGPALLSVGTHTSAWHTDLHRC